MPWKNLGGVRRRPWRRADVQAIYDELHSIRAYLVQLVQQGTTHSMQLAAIGTRLDSVEGQLAALRPRPPLPPEVADLDEARAARKDWGDLA